MKIEVGKYYRTRRGDKVLIVRDTGDHDCPMESDANETYTREGFYDPFSAVISRDDLISEWVDAAAADSEGWIKWSGGDCPVPPDTVVKTRLRFQGKDDGSFDEAKSLRWTHDGGSVDVVAYRVVEPKPVVVRPGVPFSDSLQRIQDELDTEAEDEKPVADKHAHYFHDVRHLDKIDVYRLILLYKIDHPAIQHALKKVLAAGARGAKSEEQDVQEAIDSLERWKQMRAEDQKQ